MARLQLILTCDHELFGNGTGEVGSCMIKPAEKMMDLCEANDARMTFFFDVCEYWAFREVQDQGGFSGDERPADRLEEHLRSIMERGHDVQLHFHPQWLHYEYKGEEGWELDYRMWRLPEVEQYWQEGGAAPLEELFRRGKETLEQLLRPVNSNYRCVGFRAGAWSIQPEGKVLEAMRRQGFSWETTVAPGKWSEEDLTKYDFSTTPQEEPYWKVRKEVCRPDEKGTITEYPIFTVPVSGWRNGKYTLLKLWKKVPFKPEECEGTAASAPPQRGVWAKLLKLRQAFQSGHRMFNFTDGTTFEEMKFMTEAASRQYQDREGVVPIVLIGHSKTFGNEGEFEKFLEFITKRADIEISKQGIRTG